MSGPVGTGRVRIRIRHRGLFWDGRERSNIDVQFYGKFNQVDSVTSVCQQFAPRLMRDFERTAVHDYWPGNTLPDFGDACGIDKKAPIGIFYGFPSEFLPTPIAGHAVKIGCFVCDPDAIPESWVTVCNTFDLIVVPSQYCRRVFKQCGVTTPVMVVPHGVEPEYRPYPEEARLAPFTFFNAFHPHRVLRKGTPELVRCFKRAFNGSNDYRLILHTSNNIEIQRILDAENAHDCVDVDDTFSLPVAAFARCYSRIHCVAHPSRTEGFGMIPLQALACEAPLMAPQIAGLQDFLNDENSVRIDVAGLVPTSQMSGDPDALGRVYAIDEDHLVERLRFTAVTWDERLDIARRAGPAMRQDYAWENVLQPFIDLLGALLGAASATERRALLRQVDR